MGYSPWGGKESDTTEWLTLSLFHFFASKQLLWLKYVLIFSHKIGYLIDTSY